MFKKEMQEYKVNEYITLKLENNKTILYINNVRFIQCMRLVLQIPIDDIKHYESIDSIDDAAEVAKHLFQNRIVQDPGARPVKNQSHSITPEQEFWGHCSNIQTWVENDYDTRILHSNLAFPLLKKLTQIGDKKAQKVFKNEIALRLLNGKRNVVRFLINGGFLDYLTFEEKITILESNNFDLLKEKFFLEYFMKYLVRKHNYKKLKRVLLNIYDIDLLKLIVEGLLRKSKKYNLARYNLARYNLALEVLHRVSKLDPSEQNKEFEKKILDEIKELEKKFLDEKIKRENRVKFSAFISKLEIKSHYINEIKQYQISNRLVPFSMELFPPPKGRIFPLIKEKFSTINFMEKNIKKIRMIMNENNTNILIIERKYLYEVFDYSLIKISEYDKFPILTIGLLYEFFSNGLVVETYGTLLIFTENKE